MLNECVSPSRTPISNFAHLLTASGWPGYDVIAISNNIEALFAAGVASCCAIYGKEISNQSFIAIPELFTKYPKKIKFLKLNRSNVPLRLLYYFGSFHIWLPARQALGESNRNALQHPKPQDATRNSIRRRASAYAISGSARLSGFQPTSHCVNAV